MLFEALGADWAYKIEALALRQPTYMSKKFYIESLDGIRALAFLIVFFSHTGLLKFVPGGFGVTVFFFLSGYLITTLLRMEYEEKHDIRFKNFYIRRAFRIFPSQYFVFAIALLLCYNKLIPGSPSIVSILLQTFQLTNYLTMTGTEMVPYGTGIYWSLSVEEHFYFIFPVALYFLFKRTSYSNISVMLWIACFLVLGWRLYLVHMNPNFTERIYRGTDTRIDSILFGCILAIANNPKLDSHVGKEWVWGLLCVFSFFILVLTFLIKDEVLRETIRYTMQGIALYPIFYTTIKYPNWFLYKPLNWPWLKHIGVLSYSLYLVHYIVIYLIFHYLPVENEALKTILSLVASLLLAQLMHLGIEKPCFIWRKKFLDKERVI